jgi:hypothetical protein
MTDLIVVPQNEPKAETEGARPGQRLVTGLRGGSTTSSWTSSSSGLAKSPRLGFTKATVSAWRVTLEARRLGSVSINVRLTAVRKLAVEAADNGLLAPELAAGIGRIKDVKSKGVRVGNFKSRPDPLMAGERRR